MLKVPVELEFKVGNSTDELERLVLGAPETDDCPVLTVTENAEPDDAVAILEDADWVS